MANGDTAVVDPNFGLYLGVPPTSVDPRGLIDGINFRVQQGALTNLNVGYSRFSSFTLNGPVVHIANLMLRSGTEILIFATLTDLYKYNTGTDDVSFITPIYAVGTVDVSAATPAVVTEDAGSPTWSTEGIKNGDEISFGDAAENDPDATWYIIDTVDSETQLTLTTAVTGAPLTAQAYTIRRMYTGAIFNPWDSTTFVNAAPGNEDLWFATNGVDEITKWNGTDTFAEFSSLTTIKCAQLVVYNNMLVFGNVTQSGTLKPTSIITSDLGKPEDIVNGLASQFVVHDGTDAIVNMENLGDNLVIYSDRHVTPSQFVGDPLVMVFRDAAVGIGPLGGRAVADFGDFHEFLGADSQYSFDGATVDRVNKHVWREVLRTRDPLRHPLIFSHFDEENGDLIWTIPLTTDTGSGVATSPPETAYVEHYLEDVRSTTLFRTALPTPHSKRDFPFTSSGFFERQSTLTWDQIADTWADLNFRWNDQFFTVAFPLNMVGANDGKVFTANTEQDADGVAITSFVKFPRRPIGDGRMRGLIARIYPFSTQFPSGTYDLDVTVGLTEHANAAVSASATFGLDISAPEGEHFVSPFRRARYVEIEFGTDGSNEPWELAGYDVDFKPGGRR